MTKGRVGRGASSRVAYAAGPLPLTGEQRTLVQAYRKVDAATVDATNRVRALTDDANRILAQLRASGLTTRQVMAALAIPDTGTTRTRLRIEAGRGLLDTPPDEEEPDA